MFQDKPQFISSYRGEADYLWRGRRWSVRDFAHDDGHYNGENYFRDGILPTVGTVRGYSSDDFHDFPPAELMAHFPDHVGARWNADFSALEYDGDTPETVTTDWGYIFACKIALRQCADYSPDERKRYGLAA